MTAQIPGPAMTDAAMETLAIGMSAWIIQDGNYGDFRTGQRASFALEFGMREPLVVVDATQPSMRSVGDSDYEAIGKVVYADDEWWVLDIGILIFREMRPQPNAVVGAWLAGKINIGLDPFFYFFRLAHLENAPALIYDWTIEAIEIETAPLIETSPRRFVRDPSRMALRTITETNVWDDDDGHGWYILHCRRVDGAPRRTLAKDGEL